MEKEPRRLRVRFTIQGFLALVAVVAMVLAVMPLPRELLGVIP
jgi:hypothetical protein